MALHASMTILNPGNKEHHHGAFAQNPREPKNALPQQRLTLIPDYPQFPSGWRAAIGDRAPKLPGKMPHSARYLPQVEWSWSPLHGRINAYHLSLNRSRDCWILWFSYFD